jgi:hypothetical protein
METVTQFERANFTLDSSLAAAHVALAKFNQNRLTPQYSNQNWRQEIKQETAMRLLEGEILEAERNLILAEAAAAPKKTSQFIEWFEALKSTGPGQNSPLFDWLAESANHDQMKWFIQQEVAGEAGFEDLTALTQIKMPTQPKMEMANNYWDEMGRGKFAGMHGPMLARIAEEFELDEKTSLESSTWEALALANVLLGLAMNRRFAYHSVGALGAIELTAPGRAKKVHQGLKRLGLSPEGQRYYLLHSAIDIKHSAYWNREVIAPLIEAQPELMPAIAEGALMRLNAGARCFVRYQQELQNPLPSTMH